MFELVLALVWDLILGEPPAKLHPTVWFGGLTGFFDGAYERRGAFLDFFAGVLLSLTIAVFAFLLSKVPDFLPFPLNSLLSIYLLKSSFAVKSLAQHIKNTIRDDIQERRKYVRLVVSRDVSKLDSSHLNSAAIESLAENIVDSVISPLFYYLLFGLSGALVYRAINTMDAMIGYTDDEHLYFGKFIARLDDFANFVTSRLAVVLFLPFSPRRVWHHYRLARFKINADKPIACMSAVLGVWLEKIGTYRFPGRDPALEDIERALKVYWIVAGEWIAVVLLIQISFHIKV